MSLGLPFLYRLLNTSSIPQRLFILKTNIFPNREFLTYALMEEPFDSVHHTDMLIAVQEGQDLLFQDDGLFDGPNAAWPWLTYHMVIEYFEPQKEPLRELAYVMWDLCRLEEWGILDDDPKQFFGMYR